MVGHKIGVLTEPITRTLDLNDDGVVKQPIEECGSEQVTDFVDDKQREAAKEPDLVAKGALALGLGERADEITEWREVDATAGLRKQRRVRV